MQKRIKVGFDNQIFIIQKFGGISRYFIEIFKEFDKMPQIQWSVLGAFSRNFYLKENYSRIGKIQVDHWDFFKSIRLINLLNKLTYFLPFFGLKNAVEIYHFTYYQVFYFSKLNKTVPTVVTVYDMIDEIFDGNPKTMASKKYVISNADLVLAISHSTASDLRRFYNLPADKIVVTHLASSLYPTNNYEKNRLNLPLKYILFVGLRQWYKNFIGFIEAIHPLLTQDKTLTVLCAGGGKFSDDELALLNKLNLTMQVIWKPINGDDQLACYYQNALCFVFPSKYEGFGIPILEAMNCDCPVVLSKTSSLVEVAGDAGHYFNPDSSQSIYVACKTVIESNELRLNLIEKGKIRREAFSWEKTAKATLQAYQKLINV